MGLPIQEGAVMGGFLYYFSLLVANNKPLLVLFILISFLAGTITHIETQKYYNYSAEETHDNICGCFTTNTSHKCLPLYYNGTDNMWYINTGFFSSTGKVLKDNMTVIVIDRVVTIEKVGRESIQVEDKTPTGVNSIEYVTVQYYVKPISVLDYLASTFVALAVFYVLVVVGIITFYL